jgi:outer membrane biogenesis lipoprotein LolB
VTARLGACLLAGLLAGCATAPPAVVAPPPAGTTLPDTWAASGRMAVSVAAEGGSGAFTWQQTGERTQVAVRGPLGVGAVDVTLEGDRLTVTDGEGVTLEGGRPARTFSRSLARSCRSPACVTGSTVCRTPAPPRLCTTVAWRLFG